MFWCCKVLFNAVLISCSCSSEVDWLPSNWGTLLFSYYLSCFLFFYDICFSTLSTTLAILPLLSAFLFLSTTSKSKNFLLTQIALMKSYTTKSIYQFLFSLVTFFCLLNKFFRCSFGFTLPFRLNYNELFFLEPLSSLKGSLRRIFSTVPNFNSVVQKDSGWVDWLILQMFWKLLSLISCVELAVLDGAFVITILVSRK